MDCFITILVQHRKTTKQVIMVAKTCLGDRGIEGAIIEFSHEDRELFGVL